jgi:hypothetical protein
VPVDGAELSHDLPRTRTCQGEWCSYGHRMRDWSDEWLFNELAKNLHLPEDISHQLLNWARAYRERRPVAFIGAGMSFNARPRARFRELGFRGLGDLAALAGHRSSRAGGREDIGPHRIRDVRPGAVRAAMRAGPGREVRTLARGGAFA